MCTGEKKAAPKESIDTMMEEINFLCLQIQDRVVKQAEREDPAPKMEASRFKPRF